MDRQRVSSSNVASVGYDPDTQTLEVEFNSGSIYEYYNVPKDVHEGLMNAPSHGQYLNARIKKGGYKYKQTR